MRFTNSLGDPVYYGVVESISTNKILAVMIFYSASARLAWSEEAPESKHIRRRIVTASAIANQRKSMHQYQKPGLHPDTPSSRPDGKWPCTCCVCGYPFAATKPNTVLCPAYHDDLQAFHAAQITWLDTRSKEGRPLALFWFGSEEHRQQFLQKHRNDVCYQPISAKKYSRWSGRRYVNTYHCDGNGPLR